MKEVVFLNMVGKGENPCNNSTVICNALTLSKTIPGFYVPAVQVF